MLFLICWWSVVQCCCGPNISLVFTAGLQPASTLDKKNKYYFLGAGQDRGYLVFGSNKEKPSYVRE